MKFGRAAFLIAPALAISGCSGIQSALVPRGQEAVEIAWLFWVVTGVCAVVMLIVTVLVALALWGSPAWKKCFDHDWFLFGGGIVFPVVVLSGLFVYGLVVMEAGYARSADAGDPTIIVTGKRWWWQVTYIAPDGQRVASANELRLPVGKPVAVQLETDDVIHSFWAPQLGGKLDMIPGRTNVITLEATEAGTSRGQCAEYCGGAHALMSFYVVAMPAEQFDAWLSDEAAAARQPMSDIEKRGKTLFAQNGCGSCHTIKGTVARGVIGPDLTHVGSRRSIGAATLPNDAAAFARWISDNQHIKPENLMPEYDILDDGQLQAIAAYLDSLE